MRSVPGGPAAAAAADSDRSHRPVHSSSETAVTVSRRCLAVGLSGNVVPDFFSSICGLPTVNQSAPRVQKAVDAKRRVKSSNDKYCPEQYLLYRFSHAARILPVMHSKKKNTTP
ncbi:hypothetical protein F2P81_023721 [Scophthalmus maximus]|uniref:Uncharacterized protein n=1 Tax=Scophthalmus maximus TaxID=52904 RepID=A0A6A4RVC4_SCOMX|nr:hypothetical protein F2P81_023721 [Scophthalmus maximus]